MFCILLSVQQRCFSFSNKGIFHQVKQSTFCELMRQGGKDFASRGGSEEDWDACEIFRGIFQNSRLRGISKTKCCFPQLVETGAAQEALGWSLTFVSCAASPARSFHCLLSVKSHNFNVGSSARGNYILAIGQQDLIRLFQEHREHAGLCSAYMVVCKFWNKNPVDAQMLKDVLVPDAPGKKHHRPIKLSSGMRICYIVLVTKEHTVRSCIHNFISSAKTRCVAILKIRPESYREEETFQTEPLSLQSSGYDDHPQGRGSSAEC